MSDRDWDSEREELIRLILQGCRDAGEQHRKLRMLRPRPRRRPQSMSYSGPISPCQANRIRSIIDELSLGFHGTAQPADQQSYYEVWICLHAKGD